MRIAITGPESTGKSTLAKALAEHFKSEWVEEFARYYLNEKDGVYVQQDLDEIAKGQLKWIADKSTLPLFVDTEMLVMKIWSEFKFGSCSEFIQVSWIDQKMDLYVLCSPDIPYEEDPLREHPEERETLFKLYLKELKAQDRNYIIVKGDQQTRLSQVLEHLASIGL